MKFIYKITNQINGKVYIGQTYDFACRKSQHLKEGRLDGKLNRPLYLSMRKHGIENFIFEVIEECSEKIVDEREIHWISSLDSMNPEKGYNLTPGGDGWSINHNESLRREKNRRAALAMNKTLWNNEDFRLRASERMSEQTKRFHAEGKLKAPDWTGKSHKAETKKKIGIANSILQCGSRNSQFGTVWIRNHEGISQKVKKEELETYLARGWIRGRKINKQS